MKRPNLRLWIVVWALAACLFLTGCAARAAWEKAASQTAAVSTTSEPTVSDNQATVTQASQTVTALAVTAPPRETHVHATRVPKVKTLQAASRRPQPTSTLSEQTPDGSEQPTAITGDTATPQPIPSELTVYGQGKHLVAIDVGHGGIDEGTLPIADHGPIDYTESQINLSVALRLRDILVAQGIRVVLDRTGDYYLNPDELDINGDGLYDLADEQQVRVDLINASGAELLLSLHENASTYSDGSINPDQNGSTTYYCDARPFSDLSLHFATLVHQKVLDELAEYGYVSYDQGILDDTEIDDYEPKLHLIILGPQTDRIVRPSNMPAALDEPLFATSVLEARMLPMAEVQQVLAQAYADAIMLYLAELDGG